jgi:phenylalanyl-tRNA synthetase alpha chain
MTTLRENEYRLLEALASAEGPLGVETLAEQLGLDQSQVMAAGTPLVDEGLAGVSERTYDEYRLEELGERYAREGLPERAILRALHEHGGSVTIKELPELTGLEAKTVGQSLRFLTAKQWAQKEGPGLTLAEAGRAALEAEAPDERLLGALAERGTCTAAQLNTSGVDLSQAEALLKGRKGLVRVKQRTRRSFQITEAGREMASQATVRREVNQLTSDMLADGSWQDVDFRPYDLSAETEPVYPGKVHPFRRVLEQTRRVFLELGFTEIVSPFVESSFWDFDALFQPQDHPARDMQDTFYVGRPARCALPDPKRVQAVRRTHEDGGDTGSLGWGYQWDAELAARPVLRTHTTATTIRALAEDPRPPRKVFCVGKVFRRETVDYKHLPVFYQVDGIIVDEQASFASLLGTLEAFYRKMGFDRFQFRPAFFPYTEPSVEVFVYLEQKRDWVEMGGAGVFRPEVTEPLGCKVPVLAWGLGLERLAMFRYNLDDIRQIYVADLDWLKEAELCR